jgi:SAM-dependent methyltransferase
LIGKEWFEDEEFWIAYAPLMFDESKWAEVPSTIDGIDALVGRRGESRVLDICCGVGRHSLELALRGNTVTGIDITGAYIEAARETAASMSVDIEFLKQDARYFSRPASFDLCLNLFTSFGYFSTEKEDLLMLERCVENLVPGGCLVLETIGKEIAARDFTEREEFDRAGWHVTTEYKILGAWEFEENRWILERDNKRIDRSFILRLYSAREMENALSKAGFKTVQIFGGLDGIPYDNRASTLVAVAKK